MGELIHYGVLGMHWGVRKDGKPQGFQYGKRHKKQASDSASIFATMRKSKERRAKERELRDLTLEENHPMLYRFRLETPDVLMKSSERIIKNANETGKYDIFENVLKNYGDYVV